MVSCEGTPLGRARKVLSQSCLELLDVLPGVGPGDDGADGDGHDVNQLVELRAIDPGVGQASEVVSEGQILVGHRRLLLGVRPLRSEIRLPWRGRPVRGSPRTWSVRREVRSR